MFVLQVFVCQQIHSKCLGCAISDVVARMLSSISRLFGLLGEDLNAFANTRLALLHIALATDSVRLITDHFDD